MSSNEWKSALRELRQRVYALERKVNSQLDVPDAPVKWPDRFTGSTAWEDGYNAAITACIAAHADAPPSQGDAGVPSKGALDIQRERNRQVFEEGWTAFHDSDVNSDGSLKNAAVCYAKALSVDSPCPLNWPWDTDLWKPSDYRRNLVKAGALIAAEIDRFDRSSAPVKEGE